MFITLSTDWQQFANLKIQCRIENCSTESSNELLSHKFSQPRCCLKIHESRNLMSNRKIKLLVCQIENFIIESKRSQIFGQFDLFEITRSGNDVLINR